jgi:hypothetical protein
MFLVSFNGAEFPMPNQRRNASSPNTVNCTVRKYLTAREIEKLMGLIRSSWAINDLIRSGKPLVNAESTAHTRGYLH